MNDATASANRQFVDLAYTHGSHRGKKCRLLAPAMIPQCSETLPVITGNAFRKITQGTITVYQENPAAGLIIFTTANGQDSFGYSSKE
jgi:hypothetical protein